MVTSEQIKTKLQEEINNSKLSKSEIARRLGISNQTVSCYSHGTKVPALDTFANLCKVLDLAPAEILCLNE